MKKTTTPRQYLKLQTSISIRKDYLAFARAKAEAEGRSLSNWIEQRILEIPGAGGATPKGPAKKAK